MLSTGQRDTLVIFKRQGFTTNDYNEVVPDGPPAEITRAMARIRFGTAQEKREAAQEAASQTATFECLDTPKLRDIIMTDLIGYDGNDWDITEIAPLDRLEVRFTAVRSR